MLDPFAISLSRNRAAIGSKPLRNRVGRDRRRQKEHSRRRPAGRRIGTIAALLLLLAAVATAHGQDARSLSAPTAQRSVEINPVADNTAPPRVNDYPTATRADYVIGCMAANGNTRLALLKCSCAIDTIAGLMPYADYEKAETALSLQLGGGVGGRVGLFRDPPQIKAVIEELRRAQAEANLQCR
jgi:hypothetical protein